MVSSCENGFNAELTIGTIDFGAQRDPIGSGATHVVASIESKKSVRLTATIWDMWAAVKTSIKTSLLVN